VGELSTCTNPPIACPNHENILPNHATEPVPDASNLMDSGKVTGSERVKEWTLTSYAGLKPAELTASELETWHQFIEKLTRREG